MDPTHLFLTLGAVVGLLGTVGLLVAAAGTAVVDLLPVDQGRAQGLVVSTRSVVRPTPS